MDNNSLIRGGLILLLVSGIWLTGILLHHQKTFIDCLGIGAISFTINFFVKEYEIGVIPAVLLALVLMKLGKVMYVLINGTSQPTSEL